MRAGKRISKSTPTGVVRAAGIALTKVLAGEFAPYNILVNALCTGLIMSDQVVKRWEDAGKKVSFEEHLAQDSKPVPLGRFGTEMEFANVACFLASDAASYVTGTAINIDGGRCPVW
jgi:NAD(P)-dependent dehydrogenase (short-subunit alcohol dehydrogenase family)